jgi:hypothetical protein
MATPATVEQNKFIFPLDLAGKIGNKSDSSISHPYMKLKFYDWKAQAVQSNNAQVRRRITNEFFLALPEQTIMENINHNWNSTFDWTQATDSAIAAVAGWALGGIASKSTIGAAGLDYLSATRGQGLNDYRAESYGNLGFRRFDYNFKFVPRNEAEAEEIFKIIQKIKDITTPDYKGGGAFFEFPQVCTVVVHGGDRKILYRSMMCGVDALSVNYSPTGYMRVFKDGYPLAVVLTLGIKELQKVSRAVLRGEPPE